MVRSLQELCEVGLAVDICNDYEIKESIFNISEKEDFSCRNGKYSEEVEYWHSNVLNTFSKIAENFPPWLLAGGTKNYIPLIGIEMLKWSRFHRDKFGLSLDFSKEFIDNSIFKTNGLIDREKAARSLVEETSLSLLNRMEIACYYSISDMISKLWILLTNSGINSLPSNGGHVYFKDEVKGLTYHSFEMNISSFEKRILTFNILKTTIDQASDVSFRYLWKRLEDGEKWRAAQLFMRAFLQKMKTWKNRDKCLKLQYLYESYINMFQIIVEELNNENVLKLISKFQFPQEIFVYLPNWPYQPLFLKMANLVWNVLPETSFYLLLTEIIEKIHLTFASQVYDYRLLFRKFWIASHSSLKRFIFHHKRFKNKHEFSLYCYRNSVDEPPCYDCELILKLIDINFTDDDEKILSLILESATEEELNDLLRICGKILVKAFEKGLSRFVDVFLKCCKVENVKKFKLNLLSSLEFDKALENLFNKCNYRTIDEVFKWIIGSKALAVIKYKTLLAISGNLNFRKEYVLSIKSEDNDLGIDLRYNYDTIVQGIHYFLISKKEDKVNEYVEWICHSKEKINIFKGAIYKNYSNKGNQYGSPRFKLINGEYVKLKYDAKY